MTLKTQTSRVYRGMLWVGRFYRFVGWMGLAATVFFTVWGFVMGWNVWIRTDDAFRRFTEAMLSAFIFLVAGLVLSAIAFGISLAIQVGLTVMTNSQAQIDLLRRLAQQQSEDDSVVRLQDHNHAAETPSVTAFAAESHRINSQRGDI